jgi:hypothetical protein
VSGKPSGGVIGVRPAVRAGECDQRRRDGEHRYILARGGGDQFLEGGVNAAAAQPDQYSHRGVQHPPAPR